MLSFLLCPSFLCPANAWPCSCTRPPLQRAAWCAYGMLDYCTSFSRARGLSNAFASALNYCIRCVFGASLCETLDACAADGWAEFTLDKGGKGEVYMCMRGRTCSVRSPASPVRQCESAQVVRGCESAQAVATVAATVLVWVRAPPLVTR